MKKKLLAICYEFAPATTPTAIRSTKLLKLLPENWDIEVITVESPNHKRDRLTLHSVKTWTPHALLRGMAKLKLDKFIEWFVWPDDKIFWVFPALIKALKLIRQQKPDAVIVFMMPYSAGIIGLWLKRLTRVPLLLNLDDSPTCTDMHAAFPSRAHYNLTRQLEDLYVRTADAVVYVSDFNRRMVQSRQPVAQQAKLHLIRYGADPADFVPRDRAAAPKEPLRIVYLGGMTGWYQFHETPSRKQEAHKKLYQAWMEWGRHHLLRLDHRGSSPVFLGKAIQQVLGETPGGQCRIRCEVYGNRYPQAVVDAVLASQKISDVVTVSGPIPNAQAIEIALNADLLFMALPGRTDGSSGGRISAKTYEYLMTDRPILAALPRGENWDYLADKPGVWLVAPDDVIGMAAAISALATDKAAGKLISIDRSGLQTELSYRSRMDQLTQLLDEISSPPKPSQEQGTNRAEKLLKQIL